MRLFFFILWLPVVSFAAGVDLWRGSMAALSQDEGVVLEIAGQPVALDGEADGALPFYFEGVFRLRAESGGGSFLRSSGGVDLYFEGPGDFAVERFDEAFSTSDGSTEAVRERSWLLMNLREGTLVVDTRAWEGEGQMVLVAPFCRILAPRGLWSITIEYETRNERYDFTVACAEGRLRVSDLQGQTYTLYAGQRLAGVGAFLNPAMEIGESTVRSRERFQHFQQLRASLPLDALDAAAFRSAMLDLPDRDAGEEARFSVGRPERVPLVIEYASPPRELTPFRGVIAPPALEESSAF